MILTGIALLGKDVEVRNHNGSPVASLSLAFSYGKKSVDGKRPTQWIESALWGSLAEKLAPYLTKGSAISVVLRDVRIETYEGKNGQGSKLAANVVDIELLPGKRESAEPKAEAPYPQSRPAAPKKSFDDLDDDIPF